VQIVVNMLSSVTIAILFQLSICLFDKVPEVISCGYRFATFYIFVDEARTKPVDVLKKQIKDVLGKYNIADFVLRKTSASVTGYSNHTVGSEIVVVDDPAEEKVIKATLGGFAARGEHKELCALTANHATEHSTTLIVRCQQTNTNVRLGSVLKTVNVSEQASQHEPCIDISATSIYPGRIKLCNTNFKTSQGEFVESELFKARTDEGQCTMHTLVGTYIHLWGAGSNPGRGKITMTELHERERASRVIIEDIGTREGQRLAKRGDSGSIVCADKPDGGTITAISMLTGAKSDSSTNCGADVEHIRYYTFLLEEGLDYLGKKHGTRFQLCDSSENDVISVRQGISIV